MKKILTAFAAVAALALATPAFAGQCPSDINKINAALEGEQGQQLSDEQRAEVEALRDEGQELHDAGKHQESVETLAEAKDKLGMM